MEHSPRTDARDLAFTVATEDGGRTLGAVVRAATSQAWTATKRLIERGAVSVDGVANLDPGARVRAGQRVEVRRATPSAVREARELSRDAVVFLDTHLVVVAKPPGVSTVPYEEGERGTLVDLVRVTLHRRGAAGSDAPLFVVHRIDRETSGLVVFARTWLAKRHLAALFRDHQVDRRYVAMAVGHLRRDAMTIESHLVENRGDGLRGSAKQSGLGVRAVTRVAVVGRAGGPDTPVTLVRCELETGRTHQIRIHLAEAGHPLVGERVYSRHFQGPVVVAPRLMLHAATLGFTHPARPEERVELRRAPPEDFVACATALGCERWLSTLEG